MGVEGDAPTSAGPGTPQQLAGALRGSGSASGTRPRVPGRVQARVEASLAALQERFRRALQSFYGKLSRVYLVELLRCKRKM